MNARLIGAVVLNEVRLRTRRLSTLVALFAVIAVAWMIVVDPATGRAMMVVDKARLAYNSTALALGSAMLGSLLFGLGSFYLVRGRTREDLVYGTGGILAATPVGNALFLFARWLGAVAYLAVLALAVMATMMVLQLVRGEGSVEPFTYLQMYALVLLPMLCFTASVAVLCDACSPLMGKGGDVLYFVLWIGQFMALPSTLARKAEGLQFTTAFDFSGLGFTAYRMKELFGTQHFAIGSSKFDVTLAPIVLNDFWTAEMAGFRVVSALIAILPLALAILAFHRYSPDRVKHVNTQARRSLFALVNRLLHPATLFVRPLLRIAGRTPGVAGQALADLASALIASPAGLVALVVFIVVGSLAAPQSLGGVLAAGIVCWGILVSDLSVRDYQSATESLTAAVPGGAVQRYVRQWMVTALLGLLFALPVLARWSVTAPLRAGALLAGVFALSAAASLLGRLTRTGRTFLALFLFGMYLASQVKDVQWFDAVGANGASTVESMLAYLLAGVAALAVGWVYERRASN